MYVRIPFYIVYIVCVNQFVNVIDLIGSHCEFQSSFVLVTV